MDNHFLERFLNLGPFLEKLNEGKKISILFSCLLFNSSFTVRNFVKT